jgi:ribosome-binding factor A
VNELLQREVSEQLRRRYRSAATRITISSVETSTDLRNASIYYSVIGDAADVEAAQALFRKVGRELRQRVSQRVVLKYFPQFEYTYDPSMARGAHLLDIMDQLDEEQHDED